MTAEAAPSIACAAITVAKCGSRTMVRHPAATSRPEPAISIRLARVASTSNPAGTWHNAAAMDEAAMAMPMAPDCQCSPPLRNTAR